MEPANFISIYLPLLTVFMVIIQQRKRRRKIRVIHYLLKKGVLAVSIDAFKSNIGRDCQITTMLERKVTGRINRVDGNWVEIATKKDTEYINTDFIERFRLL
jgi:SH3-like domain-containing protein